MNVLHKAVFIEVYLALYACAEYTSDILQYTVQLSGILSLQTHVFTVPLQKTILGVAFWFNGFMQFTKDQ
jgi:hypothetical protein